MAAVSGRNTKILINASDLSTQTNEANLANEAEELEVTPFASSNFRKYISGFRGGTFEVSGFWEHSTAGGKTDNLLPGILGSTANPIVTYTPDHKAGGRAWLMRSVETSYEQTAPIGDIVGISASFRSDAGPNLGRVVHTLAARTVTTNTTAYDNGGPTSGGIVTHLHVVSATTVTNAEISVQHSTSGSTWLTIHSFSGLTGTTWARTQSTGTIKRYLRGSMGALSGGAGKSITFITASARL